jgi:hypothetical protein
LVEFVDDRSIIYAADRANGGLYVLEYLGKKPRPGVLTGTPSRYS